MTYPSLNKSGIRKPSNLLVLLFLFISLSCQEGRTEIPSVDVIQEDPSEVYSLTCDSVYNFHWLDQPVGHHQTICAFIAPPSGFVRTPLASGTFGHWLRHLPLHEGKGKVMIYDGSHKWAQEFHAAVINIDVGKRDLQQCADAVMRLRAEFLYAAGREDEIMFRYTSGDQIAWNRWKKGERPVVSGNSVSWQKKVGKSGDYATFKNYLTNVFTYAGTSSLEKEMAADAGIDAGDVFIRGGFPGHAMILVDEAQNDNGEKVYLAAQSYMPAQSIHIVVNQNNSGLSPWYSENEEPLFPEWRFTKKELKKFSF